MFYDVFDCMRLFDTLFEQQRDELIGKISGAYKDKMAISSKDGITSKESYVYREYKDGELVSERNVEWENGKKVKDITSAPKIEGEGEEKPMGLPVKEKCKLSTEEKSMLEATNNVDWKSFREDVNKKISQDGKYKTADEIGEKTTDAIRKASQTATNKNAEKNDSDRLAELEKKVAELSKQNKELLEKNADYLVKFAKIKNLF